MAEHVIHLAPNERETSILYDDADRSAKVYTYNATLKKKMDRLAAERPEEVITLKSDEINGYGIYSVPKKWIKISPPRYVSEEQRKVYSERMKAMRRNEHTPLGSG